MSSLSGKRLVVLGCGYVGSAVAHAALAEGAIVEGLTRNADKAAALQKRGLRNVVVADLAAVDWHDQIAPAPDFLVNTVSSGGPETYERSYVGGMKSICDWAKSGPIGTMVYTSSTAVYPQGAGATIDESADAPGATPNGAIIRESEKLLEQASARVRARWFILRLAGIYGPGRHHLLDQLKSGAMELNGSGAYRLNLAHRDDIAAAILACLRAPNSVSSDIFNVADSAPGTRADVVRWLSDRLGRAMPTFDGTSTLRRGGAPMPDRLISSAKIQRVLGWRPAYADYRAGFENLLSH